MMMNIITNLTLYVSSPNQLCATGRTYLKGEAFDSWARVRSRNMSQCKNVHYLLFVIIFSGSAAQRGMAMASSFTRFLDHTTTLHSQ
jgi:hypothetical protein